MYAQARFESFGPLRIIENTGAEIDRGDKDRLIGANGKGKSTLLRIIAGTEPFEGERIWGHNVQESFTHSTSWKR